MTTATSKPKCGWKKCRLAYVVASANTGLDAITRAPIVEKETGVKCLRIQDISQKKPISRWGNTEVKPANFQKYQLKQNDIIMARTCSTGICTFIKNDMKAVFNNGLVRIRANAEYAFPAFLYYLFLSRDFIGHIDGISGGTSVQLNMQIGNLLSYEFTLPPITEQCAIAAVLSSLDDKIDLLHRQNKTLEGMASALWRKMFMEESSTGWKTTTVGEVATINGKSIDKDYPFEDIEYLDTGSITEGEISEYQYLQLKDAPSRAKRIVQKNDIVVSMVRPIQKHYGILKDVASNAIVSTGFVVISCVKIDPHFIYLLLTQKEMTEYLDVIAEASTSTYPSLNPSDIAEIDFQIPPVELLQQFSEYAGNTWGKIAQNNSQIDVLSHLRDMLLPKLLSGEIGVSC